MRKIVVGVSLAFLIGSPAASQTPRWNNLQLSGQGAAIETPVELVKQPVQQVPKGQIAPQGWAGKSVDGSISYMFTVTTIPPDAPFYGWSDIELAQGTANSVAGASTLLSRKMIKENGADGADISIVHPNGMPMRMTVIARKPRVYSLTIAVPPGREAELQSDVSERFLGSLKLQ